MASELLFELPTNRQSRFFDTSPNVHDPNYIPVLNGAELKVDFSEPYFPAIPSIPDPRASAAQISLKRSKSGSAPEIVVQKSPRHPFRLKTESKNITPLELSSTHSPIQQNDATFSSDESAVSRSGTDASGSGLGLEDQVFMIPGNTAPKADTLQFPIPHSARSSISSVKKNNVPTSRFAQKLPSVPSVPASIYSGTPSPITSRGASPDSQVQRQTSYTNLKSMPPLPPVPDEPAASSTMPRSQTHKSTISERRARALHSHPSNMSLKSRPASRSRSNSVVEEVNEMPPLQKQHTLQSESRPGSSRSRAQSICTSQPTPAPTAPLPDLPPGATVKRTLTRDREKVPPPISKTPVTSPAMQSVASFPSPAISTPMGSAVPSPSIQVDHPELSQFMHTNKVTIFRRFDDVHVRLLIHLQDEISALERDLLELEKAISEKPDNLAKKARILRDLRKTLAEYGKLRSPKNTFQY